MDKNNPDIKLPGNLSMPIEEFYGMVMDSLQDYSIFTTDQNLIINFWCAGSIAIFGYEPDEAIGRHYELIFTEEDRKNNIPRREMETAVREGKAADNRWHVCKDGSVFFAYGQVFPLKNDKGKLVGFVKILRDLTERKLAEDANNKHIKELEELNTHKENILAILSHDLRGPLASIIGHSDYLRSSLGELDIETARKLLEGIYVSAKDELNTLDYLLEWARIKYASEAFTPVLHELRPKVTRIFDTLKDLADNTSIKLINKVDKTFFIYADKKMLHSILKNLVSNAIKNNHPGGSVTISATKEGDMIKVAVTDSGIGMPKEQIEKLFVPQIKSLAMARQEGKGGGIGLLLVKGLLKRNGGEIAVESEEGKGSTFYFTLPLKEPTEYTIDAGTLEIGQGI